MPSNDFYGRLLDTYDRFVEEGQRKRIEPCEHAVAFVAWANERFEHLSNEPTPATLNQARLELLDKYFDWLQAVSNQHRITVPGANSHVCILEVFQAGYFYLTELALRSLHKSPERPVQRVRRPISITILKARGLDIEDEEAL